MRGSRSVSTESDQWPGSTSLMDQAPAQEDLLAILAREPGRPFTRTQLLELAYDINFAGFDRTVDAHIKNLRRKIEPDPRNPKYILTIYGVGYKFAEDIE